MNYTHTTSTTNPSNMLSTGPCPQSLKVFEFWMLSAAERQVQPCPSPQTHTQDLFQILSVVLIPLKFLAW